MKLFVIALLVAAGATSPTNDAVSRIVGGHNAEPHQFPWQVTLQVNGRHFCGGSIISEKWILTAAHCVKTSEFQIIGGKHDLTQIEPSEQHSNPKRIITHKSYVGGNGSPHDIALIELVTPFKFTKEVQAVKLPTKDEAHSGQVTLSGWGSISTSFPSYPKQLQTVDKPIVPYDECEKILGGPGATPLHETNLCAGSGGVTVCSADSGGPLVQYQDGEATIVGVVSWGFFPCGGKKPSIYVRVSAYLDWIEENTK